MASLLKGQILKHLSKFTKNFSPDKLNLSALKGSCEAQNIELNENVLMDLLELPLWMSLTKATCNYASLKIQWMKLKTVPIVIALDEVVVEIETCDTYRSSLTKRNLNSNDTGKYGFIDRVFDGITVTINSVIVRFKSIVFHASLQLSRMILESRTPQFKKCNNLRYTRIKDMNRGEILIFKHLEWQSLRIEGKAETDMIQTPLRLITNQTSCRITIKKRLNDCAVLGARNMLIFDDLLWVLTDTQLLSAMHFADYLSELINKSPRSKNIADDHVSSIQMQQSLNAPKSSVNAQLNSNPIGRFFTQYDVIETSHHLFVGRIEIHLCDDLDPNNGRSLHPSLKDGGALQITLLKLVIDVYPYQRAIGSRQHWLRYSDPASSRGQWINQHLHAFVEKCPKSQAYQLMGNNSQSSPRMQIQSVLSKLMSRVILIRLGDYSIGCVTTNVSTKKEINYKLISTDKGSFSFPDDMDSFYLEINNYYFHDQNENTPNPAVFVHLAPLKVCFDALSLLWLNAFQSNLQKAMNNLQQLMPKSDNQVNNTRIECLMPVICINCPDNCLYSSLEIKSARIVVMNSYVESSCSQQLNTMMEEMGQSAFFYDRDSYPWLSSDVKPLSDSFLEALNDADSGQLWVVKMDPFWIEFKCRKNNKLKPFVDPMPIIVWSYVPPQQLKIDGPLTSNNDPDINVLLCIPSVVRVQINHIQLLFLMKFLDEIGEFNAMVNRDTLLIQGPDASNIFKRFSLTSAIPNIEIILILSENFIATRSIGLSPHSSFIGNSPSMDEDISIHSDAAALAAYNESKDVTAFIKSRSDSSLNGSTMSNNVTHRVETNSQNNVNVNLQQLPLSAAPSIASVPLKLQNAPQITNLKKNVISNHSMTFESLPSGSTFNESGFSDMSPYDDDNRSIRSDISVDSDQFVMLGSENAQSDDELFGSNNVEVADEVKEDSVVDSASDSCSDPVIHALPDVPVDVTVLHVKASDINVVQQSFGYYSALFLKCSHINVKEYIKMPFTEFQAFTNQRLGLNQDSEGQNAKSDPSMVTVRIDTFAKPEFKEEMISVRVNNVVTTLNIDTVLQLSDFVTDENETRVPPAKILIDNVNVTLIDDKVRTPPLSLNIPKCMIERNSSNQITLIPIKLNHPKSTALLSSELLSSHIEMIQRHAKDKTHNEMKLTLTSDSGDAFDHVPHLAQENESIREELKKLRLENEVLRRKLENRI